MTTLDLFDVVEPEVELIEEVVEDLTVSRTVSMEVELPHADAVLVCIRPLWDGSWTVTLRDRLGVGNDSLQTGRADSPLLASRMIAEGMLASITQRIEKNRLLAEASAARRAALGAGATYTSGATLRPAGEARRGRPPESQTVTGAYTGSVPRNALVWDVSPSGVRVQLKSGLVWADVGGSEERVFKTVRLAKDNTRGAVNA